MERRARTWSICSSWRRCEYAGAVTFFSLNTTPACPFPPLSAVPYRLPAESRVTPEPPQVKV